MTENTQEIEQEIGNPESIESVDETTANLAPEVEASTESEEQITNENAEETTTQPGIDTKNETHSKYSTVGRQTTTQPPSTLTAENNW